MKFNLTNRHVRINETGTTHPVYMHNGDTLIVWNETKYLDLPDEPAWFAVAESEVTVKCWNYGSVIPEGEPLGHCPNDAEEFHMYRGLLCGFCAAMETHPSELEREMEEAQAEAEWARMVPWG